jgi:hypothetical protein
MSVQIIKNFIKTEDAHFVVNNFSKHLSPVEDKPSVFEDLFIRKPVPMPDHRLDINNTFDSAQESFASAQINNFMYLAKLEIEKFYDTKLTKCVGGMTRLTINAATDLHADMYNLDGTELEDDEDAKILQYSGLIYLSDYGKDFLGGILKFPEQELDIYPETGMFVFFKGDHTHPHEVSEVTSGNRHAIVMFFGN